FEILYEPVLLAEADYDRTIFDASFVNPFEEDAERLATAWRSIREKFERESPNRRVDALAEALAQAGVQVDGGEADEILARVAGFVGEEAASAAPRPEAPYTSPTPQAWPQPVSDPIKMPASPALNAGRRGAAVAGQSEPVQDRLFNALAKAFAKVTSTPWQFRHEFIGQTVVQTPDHAAIYSGDPSTLKDFLLDTSIPAEETERRFAVVEALADDVVLHQFGMLDGYRSSVQEGSRTLLEEVDPEVVENTVRQGGAVYRWFAPLRKARVFDLLVARRRELQGEDWSVSERRIFRPAFIRSYLARVATGHH
ncbi:MAG TPA: type VI secretion system-associated FHA domain protein, partial [Rhodothermales bacterium]|nr:type VI secretion system-associated FHA domain protein [Rhodothermales bacterium]